LLTQPLNMCNHHSLHNKGVSQRTGTAMRVSS